MDNKQRIVILALTLPLAACVSRAAATAPPAAGCITDLSTGDHVYSCAGFRVDARVPAACRQPGCGLILELHGDTGTGVLEDEHTRLRELGAQYGFILIAPTGPPFGSSESGSTWSRANDAPLMDIVREFSTTFRVNAKNVHVTGFSRGGFVTWRLLCDHANVFASGAPGAAGNREGGAEPGCFSSGHAPSRHIPILLLMGRTDQAVSYPSMVALRDAALASYRADTRAVLAEDARYTHTRWTSADGAVVETLDHAYETVADGPWGGARGHCIPGSTVNPYAPQYALACKPPTAFNWGEEVMAFFRAHPMP